MSDNVRTRALVDVASPDSSYSLDFDMYLDYDQEGLEREPDSAPVLADFRRDTLWQVAFCGTPCDYDGAYWVDARRFALTGTVQSGPQEDGPRQGFLDIYDLSSRRTRSWRTREVDDAGFARFGSARDSALIARFEKARREAASSDTRSRVGLADVGLSGARDVGEFREGSLGYNRQKRKSRDRRGQPRGGGARGEIGDSGLDSGGPVDGASGWAARVGEDADSILLNRRRLKSR